LIWDFKTNVNAMDFDIAEEIILTDKLSVEKYVKRIYIDNRFKNKNIIKKINKKYPHIEVIIIEGIPYYNKYKKYKKEKEKESIIENKKEKVKPGDFITRSPHNRIYKDAKSRHRYRLIDILTGDTQFATKDNIIKVSQEEVDDYLLKHDASKYNL
jgi:hypothetical protein